MRGSRMRGFPRNNYQHKISAKVGTVSTWIFVTMANARKSWTRGFVIAQRIKWKDLENGEIQTGIVTAIDPLKIDRL